MEHRVTKVFTLDNSEWLILQNMVLTFVGSLLLSPYLFWTVFICHSFTFFSYLEIRQQKSISKRRKYKNATKPFIVA